MSENNIKNNYKIALLLPSYNRIADIINVIKNTELSDNIKFIVTANYTDDNFKKITDMFGDKIFIVDERKYGKGGMIKAYNLAFFLAKKLKFDYVALWADDIFPMKTDWHIELNRMIDKYNFDFGIFSTDECHKKIFGWNFFNRIPNAHFFIAKTSVLGDFFLNPSLNAYVGDYEVCIRMIKKNVKMTLIPIKINHYPTANETRGNNSQYYNYDINIFNLLYPEYEGVMDNVVLYGDYNSNGSFILDNNEILNSDFYSDFFISYIQLLESKL